MDISKLPRLSKTEGQAPGTEPQAGETGPPPPPAAPPQAVAPIAYAHALPPEPIGAGPEAWISIGIGLIFVFAFPHFTQWWIHQAFHTKTPSFLPITDSNGAQVPYPQSIFFLSDLAVALFAYALVVDGIALLLWRRAGMLAVAILITAAAVALNAYYIGRSFLDDSGFPVISAVAVVFGGYMLWYQSKVFAGVRRRRAARQPTA